MITRRQNYPQMLLLSLTVCLLCLSGQIAVAAQEQIVFKLESLGAVYNHPPQKTVFTLSQPTRITKIWTYHWNGGQGSMPGSISLRNVRTGQLLGSWEAVGTQHMFNSSPGARWPSRGDGPPWLYWTIQPQIELPSGSYELLDSDPRTWSTNAEVGHRGVAWIYGMTLSAPHQSKSVSDRRKSFILDDDAEPTLEPATPRTADKLVITRQRPHRPPPQPAPPTPRYEPPQAPQSSPQAPTGCSDSSAINLAYASEPNSTLKEISVHDQDTTLLFKIAGYPSGRVSVRLTPTKEFANRRIGTLSVSGNKIQYKNVGDAFEGVLEVRSIENPALCRTFRFTLDVGCVPAGTQVTMADGSRKPIETIKQGDVIRAYDTAQHRLTQATVQKTLVHDDITYLLHELKTDASESLLATGNHPILTKEGGWKNVDQLRPGDTIYHYIAATGSVQELPLVAIIRDTSEKGVVYNLKTSKGNYFANGILVHNKCLKKGSLITTPYGKRAIEALRPGDFVMGEINGMQQAVRVTNVYEKQTVLQSLPGRQLADKLTATVNHLLYRNGVTIAVGAVDAPAVEVAGTVYDLRTESGNYLSEGLLLQGGE